jgi:hypothetical protein
VKINRTGYWLLALFGLGGIAFIVFLPWNPIGYIWVAVTLFLIVYALRQRAEGSRNLKLFKSGERGRATVVEASSGMLVNNQPRMKLVLEIAVPGQEPYRAEHTEVMSSFVAARMKPGMQLPVVVDPGKPDEFVLVW